MTAGFNCELTLAGVEAHHSRKNVAQLNRLTFIHFMCIEFHNPWLRNSVSCTSCLTLAIPWTVAGQAPLSTGFSRQEYWSGLPCTAPGNLLDSGIEPSLLHLQAGSLTLVPSGKIHDVNESQTV